MLRTVFTPSSNSLVLTIPDKFIGTELEVNVFPLKEISSGKPMNIARTRKIGILEGKVFFKETGDGKITTEEFLGI